MSQAALDRLVEALGFPTVTAAPDRAPFSGFGEFLERAFPRVHAVWEWEVLPGGTRRYCARGTRPELQPDLYVSHFDVVPEGDRSAWSRNPWGERAEGRIYGRGALDVKSGLMALLEAAEALVEEGWRPERDLWWVFGHDEETGGAEGAAAAARRFQEEGVRFRCVLDEGGAIVANPLGGGAVAAVGVAEKGWVDVRVTARGAGGHASLTSDFNPLVALAEGVARLPREWLPEELPAPAVALLRTLARGRPVLAAALRVAVGAAPRRVHRALARIPDLRPQVATLLTPTVFTAGHAPNAVPDRAEVVLNCRIVPGTTRAEVVEFVRRAFPDPRFSVEPVGPGSEPSPAVDAAGPDFQRLSASIAPLAPLIAPTVFTGITDSRHYVGVSDAILRFIPLRLTPANRSGIHGVDEHIEEANYLEIIEFYKDCYRRAGVA